MSLKTSIRERRAKSLLSLHYFVDGQFYSFIPLVQTAKIDRKSKSLHVKLFGDLNGTYYSSGAKSV